MNPSALGIALLLGLAGSSFASAKADSRVLLASVESTRVVLDDESRAAIDEALATAASTIEDWRIVSAGVSTSLLRRDGACGVLDEGCLERAAERRGIDRILLAQISPSPESEEQVELTVRLFDRYTRTMRGTFEATIEFDDLDSSRQLESLASELIPLVGELPAEGAAVIRACAGAEVFVDGVSVGTVPSSGEFTLTPVPVGRRMLRVVRPSRTVWEAPVVIRPRESVSITVDVGAAVASFDPNASSNFDDTSFAATAEAPPAWVLTVPGVLLSTPRPAAVEGEQVDRVRFRIPMIEDHIRRGEIRTTMDARVGFMPHVSSRGARFTAKLHF